ncbi:hypothetical protein GSB9_03078 [Flavobacteriaceae bacterium GSB9]|nr:hypothetical protein GSB9_03078 [Flavobacteriaceae bacterium GSB9]
MKTTKYILKFRTLLVFVTSALIIACSSDDENGQGPTFDTTPGNAVLTLPLNDEPCEIGELRDNKARVLFTWNASEATEKYDLEIINLVTGETINRLNLVETSKEVTLQRGYSYSWKIISKNSGDTTTFSDTWKFYVSGDGEANGVPFPATLLSPASGVTITPVKGNVTLEWESSDADGDDVTYTVFIDTVDGNQEVPESHKDITDNSIDVAVESGTVYFWHIETSDGVNTSISATYTFKVAD